MGINLLAALSVGLLSPAIAGSAEAPAAVPDFKEVYDQVRAHLEGATDADLNRAAIEGFISALGSKVTLEGGGNPTNTPAAGPAVSRARVFDNDIAYLRFAHLSAGAAKAVRTAYDHLASSNKVKGVVLDLRYTEGTDYAGAAAIADLFILKEKPLLDWGAGLVRSKSKTDAIALPVAVLVNGQTKGAPEALAAVLRATGTGLILGGKTAGQAMIASEFPLKNGQRLRIATAPLELGDGTKLSGEGLKPDISVDVTPEDERAYYADAFRTFPRTNLLAADNFTLTNHPSGTNRAARRSRFNEAELVRERREGLRDNELIQEGSRESDPERPAVRDPVLGRAIDVLKGLAVVRAARS